MLSFLIPFFLFIAKPDLVLKKNKQFNLPGSTFYHATDGHAASQRTNVSLLYTQDTLHVTFECLDDPFHKSNTYMQNNDPIYKQEVFELFIGEGEEIPVHYIELEINPNNALFSGRIENETHKRLSKLTLIPHSEAGIRHTTTRFEKGWKGEMHIPLSLIGPQKGGLYRLNFYRIALYKQPEPGEWDGNVKNSDYICWKPTMSGKGPDFHRSDSFGLMKLVK